MADTTPQEQQKAVPKVEYTDAEKQHRGVLISQLSQMRDDRDRAHPELDGMTWMQYYENNRKKDLSYIEPKKNKQDVRIVTGTTREKNNTLLSTLLNLNLTPDITAFDQEDMIVAELGDNMSDLVLKSREIEDYAKKRPIYYREMIAQGDVFIEEIYVEKFKMVPTSELTWNPSDGTPPSAFEMTERLKRVFAGCSTRMIPHPKIYLGSMRIPHVEDQHRVAILNIYTRAEAETIYSKWERWKYVPRENIVNVEQAFETDGRTYKDWNLVTLDSTEKVAEIKIFDPSTNRFQIFLNGVMMLPINYPLSAIAGVAEIPMAQGKGESISNFALSKSKPSKTKVEQAVIDEITTLMVEAFRQGRKPPMGTKSKKVYGRNIFAAGTVTPDIGKDDLFPLLPNGSLGLTTADFSFYSLIKQQIDDKTISTNFEGGAVDKQQTAYEVDTLKSQQMLKLALDIDGAVNLERRLTWLRIYGILTHWTKPIDPTLEMVTEGVNQKYRDISVNTTLENGESGVKVFRMTDEELPTDPTERENAEGDQEDEEERLTKEHGKPVRIVRMNINVLSSIKWTWFIIINPTPKSNDKLAQLLYVQNLRAAMEIFGPDAINQEYAKQRYAILINEDPNKYFNKQDIMQMLQQGMDAQGRPQAGAKQVGAKDVLSKEQMRAVAE